jgi:transcriptional regulator with GAF, ATPase, and Fis domain
MSSNLNPPSLTITAVSAAADEGSLVRVRQLRTLHAPKSGRWPVAVLAKQPVEIGRIGQVAGPLGLDDREVSRLHAIVEPQGDGTWRIVDQKSRNGTYVNGARVEQAPLSHGSIVRVGKTILIYLDQEIGEEVGAVPDTPRLFGRSEPVRRLRADLAMVASKGIPVLILGETGVGKELVAEEIHRLSGRPGPFIAVNCAALPEALAESELFGHVAGAFTGANKKSDGLFVAAQGGTLFLDEIGETPAPVQAKLLRALAKGEIRAVGAADVTTVDVRIIAATNRDLATEIASDTFRADLYSRLSGWTQRIPPLRDRKDDILPLALLFLGRVAPGVGISTNAAEALLLYNWPFNVRELEQVMGAAGVRATAVGRVRCEHLPDHIAATLGSRGLTREAVTSAPVPSEPPRLHVPRDEAPDREGLLAVVTYFGGNIAQVADYFGKDRKQIYRWAERFDIDLAAIRKD